MNLDIVLNRQDMLDDLLNNYAMHDEEVYLHPLLPAIEIAWLDTKPSLEARQLLWSAGQFVRHNLSEIANGLTVVSEVQLIRFLLRYFDTPAQPPELKAQADLSLAYTRLHSSKGLVKARLRGIWHLCYRVACCNPEGEPNTLQWLRLQEIAPPRHDFTALITLGSTDGLHLLDELRNAQQQL